MLIFITGCAQKQPIKSQSSTILIKTPTMKYHDNGFITYYDDFVHLQLLNLGTTILDLTIYKNKICKSSFECLDSKDFNTQYIHSDYKESFLYDLFKQKNIYFKDKQNNILIKVK